MGASLFVYDPFCSPDNVRLKHSYQRSHFLVKKPTELISFVSFLWKPWNGEEQRGSVVWWKQHSIESCSWLAGLLGRVVASLWASRFLACKSRAGLHNQRSHPAKKISRLPDDVLVLNWQWRKHIVYDTTFQNDLVTNSLWSREMPDFWPPELWFFFNFYF